MVDLKWCLLILGIFVFVFNIYKTKEFARKQDSLFFALSGALISLFFLDIYYWQYTVFLNLIFVFGTASIVYTFVNCKTVISYSVYYAIMIISTIIAISYFSLFTSSGLIVLLIYYLVIISCFLGWFLTINVEQNIYIKIGFVICVLQIAFSCLFVNQIWLQQLLAIVVGILALIRQLFSLLIFREKKSKKLKKLIRIWYI